MVTADNAYEKLAEKIGAAGYPTYLKVLENVLTPDEAELVLQLAAGASATELAQTIGIDAPTLAAKIDDLLKRRILLRGPGGYVIPRSPRFFPRGPDTQRTLDLFTDFFRSGDYQKILVDGWNTRMANGAPQSHKVIPARQALLASPNPKPEQILWYEDMGQLFQRVKIRWQRGLREDGSLGQKREGGCGCRTVWNDACDAIGGCTGWEWQPGEWGITPDASSSAPVMGGNTVRREISAEEAIAASDRMEDAGQIHISPNTAQITGTCNCCECCCVIMQPMKNHGNVYEMLAPSRYRAVIDHDLCTGCQTCVERCHFDAIEMRKVSNSKKMKAYIVDEHCMGCGLCIYKCPSHAMHFELVRPAEHIPTGPWVSPSTYQGAKARTAGIQDART